MKVFLGGTCNESTWRDRLIPMLQIEYYNPVVADWTPACQAEEIRQRELCDFCLYTVTPLMTGVYAIAEVVDDSNKRPKATVFCVLSKDGDSDVMFTAAQVRSLYAVVRLVKANGVQVFDTLEECAGYLNSAGEES